MERQAHSHLVHGLDSQSRPSNRTDCQRLYPHIVDGDDGTARIGDTRYKVEHLAAEHYHYGWTAEELLRQHPDLRPEEVYAALTYYDHHDELVAEMTATADDVEAARRRQTLSRAELLRRKTG